MTAPAAKLGLTLVLIAGLGATGWLLLHGRDDHAVLQWQDHDELPLRAEEAPPGPMSVVFDPTDRVELAADPGDAVTLVGEGRIATVIAGRVVDHARAPLAGAQVVLEIRRTGQPANRDRNRIRRPVLTGSDGRFTFAGRAYDPLTITVIVTHPHHAVTVVDRAFAKTPPQIDLGDLAMLRGGTLAGSVTDPDGRGIAGARVRLEPQRGNRLAWMRGGDDCLPVGTTDGSGGYRLDRLPPGDYRIVAAAPRHEQRWTDVVPIDDGEEQWLPAIVLGPGHVFAGRVFAAIGGQPVENATVVLSRTGRREQATSDAGGRFEIAHVPPGTYALQVQARGYVTHRQAEVDVRYERDHVIELAAGLVISGTVTDRQTGAAIEAFAARPRRVAPLPEQQTDDSELQRQVSELREQLRQLTAATNNDAAAMARARAALAAELQARQQIARRGQSANAGAPRRSPARAEVRRHPGGAFSFEGLDEGVYVVDVDTSEHQPLTSDRIELRHGAVVAPLRLLATRGLVIAGAAHSDDAGVAGARVQLLRAPDAAPPGNSGVGFGGFGDRRTVLTTTTDSRGLWSFATAVPGRYVVQARAAGYAIATTEPFELSADRRDIDLRLGPLASLSGRILAAGRTDFAEVYVLAFAGPGKFKTIKAAADGSYRLTDLQPGAYLVRAFTGTMRTFLAHQLRQYYMLRAEGTPPPADIELAAGAHRTLDVTLQREMVGGLRGTVVVNGAPAAQLRVSLRPLSATGDPRAMDPVRRFSAFGGYRGSTRTDRQGEFQFDSVPEGEYLLAVRSARRSARQLAERQVSVVRDQVQSQHIAIATSALTGTVTDPSGGDPVDLAGTLQLFAGATEVPAVPTGAVHRIAVRAGAFAADDILPGPYLAVLRLHGRQLTTRSISIDPGAVEVQLAAGAPTDGNGKGK